MFNSWVSSLSLLTLSLSRFLFQQAFLLHFIQDVAQVTARSPELTNPCEGSRKTQPGAPYLGLCAFGWFLGDPETWGGQTVGINTNVILLGGFKRWEHGRLWKQMKSEEDWVRETDKCRDEGKISEAVCSKSSSVCHQNAQRFPLGMSRYDRAGFPKCNCNYIWEREAKKSFF